MTELNAQSVSVVAAIRQILEERGLEVLGTVELDGTRKAHARVKDVNGREFIAEIDTAAPELFVKMSEPQGRVAVPEEDLVGPENVGSAGMPVSAQVDVKETEMPEQLQIKGKSPLLPEVLPLRAVRTSAPDMSKQLAQIQEARVREPQKYNVMEKKKILAGQKRAGAARPASNPAARPAPVGQRIASRRAANRRGRAASQPRRVANRARPGIPRMVKVAIGASAGAMSGVGAGLYWAVSANSGTASQGANQVFHFLLTCFAAFCTA